MPEPISTGIAIAAAAAKIYGIVSAIKSGRQAEAMLDKMDDLTRSIKKLSENIFLLDSFVVENTTLNRQMEFKDYKRIHDEFSMYQKILGQKIITSNVINTPSVFENAFIKNPWDVLFDIKPLQYSHHESSDSLIPILFKHDNQSFVGWQKKGLIPVLLNCDYNEDKWMNINTPKNSFLQELINIHEFKLGYSDKAIVESNISKYQEIEQELVRYDKDDKLQGVGFVANHLPQSLLNLGLNSINGYQKCISVLQEFGFKIEKNEDSKENIKTSIFSSYTYYQKHIGATIKYNEKLDLIIMIALEHEEKKLLAHESTNTSYGILVRKTRHNKI